MLQRQGKGWKNDTSVRKTIKNNGQFLRSRDRKRLLLYRMTKNNFISWANCPLGCGFLGCKRLFEHIWVQSIITWWIRHICLVSCFCWSQLLLGCPFFLFFVEIFKGHTVAETGLESRPSDFYFLMFLHVILPRVEKFYRFIFIFRKIKSANKIPFTEWIKLLFF